MTITGTHADWIVGGFLVLCGLAYIVTCAVYSGARLVAAARQRRDLARHEAAALALANEDRPGVLDLMPLIDLHADSLPADMRMEK